MHLVYSIFQALLVMMNCLSVMSVTQRAGKGSWRWLDETQRTIKKNWSIAWNQGTFPKPTSWQQVSVQLFAAVSGYAGFYTSPILQFREMGQTLSGSCIGVPSALWKPTVLPFACFATDLLFMALSNTKTAAYCRSVCMCETLMF